MVISDQATPNKEQLLSHFVKSKLWVRGGVNQLDCLPVSAYVDPAQRMPKGSFDATKDLSKAMRHKQWMGGQSLSTIVRSRLWSGMGLTSGHKACLVDMLGFDGSFAESVMKSPSTLGAEINRCPEEMVVTAVWAQTDLDRGNTNELIAQFLNRSQQSILNELLISKKYFLDGWDQKPFEPNAAIPVLNPSSMKATCPTRAGSLALRQSWVDMVAAKVGQSRNSESWRNFVDLMKAHNLKYNKSAKNFVDGQLQLEGEKRGANNDGDGDNKRFADAVEVPEKAGQPVDKTKLVANGGQQDTTYIEVAAQNQELLFGSDGSLWLHGLEDGYMSNREHLCCAYGRFALNAEAKSSQGKAGCWLWQMKSGAHEVRASMEKPFDNAPPYTSKLAPLEDFYKYLAVNGNHHEVSIECHQAKLSFQKNEAGEITSSKMSITPTQPCVFISLPLPSGYAETGANAGSRLLTATDSGTTWDFSTGVHRDGWLRMKDHIHFEMSRQCNGIVPTKPGIYLTKNIKVTKGALRRLA
jgi:hypothetical protein